VKDFEDLGTVVTTPIPGMETGTGPGDSPRHPSTTGHHVSGLAPVFGVSAALIGLADMAPYVRDTVRDPPGRTAARG
jgi:hypothetical protein